jgi:ABC-type hemin transport system ATPase subunit
MNEPDRSAREELLARILADFDLERLRNRKPSTFSGSERRRVEVTDEMTVLDLYELNVRASSPSFQVPNKETLVAHGLRHVEGRVAGTATFQCPH